MESTLWKKDALHVAIIMDGNGRWATRRGLPRPAGHRAGVAALRRIVEAAPALGIATLTLFAFSADNWRRPAAEVAALLSLLERSLRSEAARLRQAGVRLGVIGRRDRLPPALVREIAALEQATVGGRALHLRIALDYSGREAILHAAALAGAAPSREDFGRLLDRGRSGEASPDVDLLIRSGGEQRLSDFLLWESAYAELVFTDRLWPDFEAADLRQAVETFRRRERRFGGLPASSPRVAEAAGI